MKTQLISCVFFWRRRSRRQKKPDFPTNDTSLKFIQYVPPVADVSRYETPKI